MKNFISKLFLGTVLVIAAAYSSAKTVVFDTVTSYQSGKDTSSYPYTSYSVISGIEKDTAVEVSAQFGSNSYDRAGNGVAQVCTPSVITAMEKPGRYYLYVTWDDNDRDKQITHCTLELKNIPE